MTRRILLGAEARGLELAALVVDGVLSRLLAARLATRLAACSAEADPDAPPTPGDVFQARIGRRKGASAFLDLGDQGAAFLPEAARLRPGDGVTVEIDRPAEGGKAPRASRRIAVRGRYAVMTLGAPGVNASKRLRDPMRRAGALALAGDPPPPEGCGVVIRSAVNDLGDDLAPLAAELQALRADLATLLSEAACATPGRLRTAPSPVARALRDWWSPPPDALLLAPACAHRADPALTATTAALEIDADPLERLDLYAALDALTRPRAAAPPGWIHLARTEALIAIDVNAGDGAPTAVNHAAALEIARQLHLRGWGGQAVIDFAPTTPAERPRLERALAAALGAEARVAGWGPLGLLEFTLRREWAPFETLWRPENA